MENAKKIATIVLAVLICLLLLFAFAASLFVSEYDETQDRFKINNKELIISTVGPVALLVAAWAWSGMYLEYSSLARGVADYVR